MRISLSIKAAISLLVLLLGMILIVLDLSRNERLLEERSLARLEREAQMTGARIAGLMQHCFRNHEPRVAELEMSYATLLPDISHGLVVDESGLIRYATRLQWTGVPIEETPLGNLVTPDLISRASLEGLVVRDESFGQVLALYPFYASFDPGDLGMVILSFDASRALVRSKGDAFWESLSRACYLSAACLFLWLSLDLVVTRRVDRLLEFARRVREGLPAGNPEVKNDELGLIAGTFADSVEKLRETEARLLEASEEERRRIGRDIHDDVCQRIAAAQLKCGILSRMLSREGLPHAETAVEVSRELQEAVTISRGFAHGLCPVRVDTEGLAAALKELAEDLGRSFGASVKIEVNLQGTELPHVVETHIFRIVQELVTNALKHARPERVRASVTRFDRELRIEVENDGLEFDGALDGHGHGGLGLGFVQQRARALGGHLQFFPRSGGGSLAVCVATFPESNPTTEKKP